MFTIIRTLRDGGKTYRHMEFDELTQSIRSSRYADDIRQYRKGYHIRKRESASTREAITTHMLQDVPFISFARNISKRNGEIVVANYNPMVLLTVSNLRDPETAVALRDKATKLPYTRLAFVGYDAHSLVIVCEATAVGRTDDGSDAFVCELLSRAHAMLRKVYSDHLHATIDASSSPAEDVCRMSADAGVYYNRRSAPFHTDMLARSSALTDGIEGLRPATVHDVDDREYWRQIFIDNMRKAQQQHFCSNDAEYEILLTLVHYCHETGMPQTLVEAFCRVHGEFCAKQQLVSDTVSTEYESDLRGTANPRKYANNTAMLIMRTNHFMNVHFRLRRNVLNRVVEYRLNDGTDFQFHPLDKEMQNTMTIMALEAGLDSWDKDLNRYIHSKRIPEYDPVNEWLDSLPKWDGKDRVTALARRVPTDTPHWEHDFHVWMLSMVAQWRGIDSQHGNAIAPILIGAQATGKSTFCQQLLPEALIPYYNDNINFKDDKSVFMALSSFALINIDEFDSLSRSQQPLLKYLISKTDVKYREAYTSFIANHKRYASFIGTTNCPQPLSDPTGSRRFICVSVKEMIDIATPVEHEQLYAQLLAELASGACYWFTKEEADRITQQNAPFERGMDLTKMILSLFSKPADLDQATPVSLTDILDAVYKKYPNVQFSKDPKMQVGRVMKSCGFVQGSNRNSEGKRWYYVMRR